jgi:hypothetical protein
MDKDELEAAVKGLACDAVDAVKDVGLVLDYTPGSISTLEKFCGMAYKRYKTGIFKPKIAPEKRENALESISFTCGAYLGEIIRPQINASWIIDEEQDGAWALKTVKGSTFPIRKVWKRITDGDGENLEFYYQRTIVLLKTEN